MPTLSDFFDVDQQRRRNELKARLRSAVLDYYAARDGFSGDCGAHMMAVIRPDIGLKAKKANELAEQLKQIDPDFPKSWVPFSTGES